MPYINLNTSQLVPNVSPVTIYYREEGEGMPLVFLHGGWGYGLYPFDHQIGALRSDWRLIAPDRSGYGRSTHIVGNLPTDFHLRAVSETLGLLDALHIERAFLWGHSDGAVIGAILGITAPDRISGLILESFHYYRVKNHSREFYETLAYHPETLGESLCRRFEVEHGKEYWKTIISTQGKAWLDIADKSDGPGDDLYAGTLNKLLIPTLFIHGRHDPRTEPGELDAVRRTVENCNMKIVDAYHSPHSESASFSSVTEIAEGFLRASYTR